MTKEEFEPRYFIVKHDLGSFTLLPEFAWRTGTVEEPKRFKRVRKGDFWIAFAYIEDEIDRQPLSLVTGFYQCIQPSKYRSIPISRTQRLEAGLGNTRKAWMIKGEPFGTQPSQPVSVPIYELLDKSVYQGQAIIPGLSVKDFDRVRKETLKREREPDCIPLLKREPYCEQELLAIVIADRERLGIEILEVGKGFPDLLVKIKGHPRPVHLELEVCCSGFISHGHHYQVRNGKLSGTDEDVGVLCWLDDDKGGRVHRLVRGRVYELQSLIRKRGKVVYCHDQQ